MSVIEKLCPVERIELDQARLGTLYEKLGDQGAQSVVCRAMEELGTRLSQCGMLWREGKIKALRKNCRSLIAISEQIGMHRLAQVAADVTACIDSGDEVALSATLARLARTGERSLSAVLAPEGPPG